MVMDIVVDVAQEVVVVEGGNSGYRGQGGGSKMHLSIRKRKSGGNKRNYR